MMLLAKLVAVIVVVSLCSSNAPSASAQFNHRLDSNPYWFEVDALITFKGSLKDRDSRLTSWDPNSADPCTWRYVTCEEGRVTRIDLGRQNLGGTLDPALAKLEKLQYLELYMNDLSGTIPAELGNLKELISLDLHNNQLRGWLPTSLGNLTSVVTIRVNNNKLYGRIPSTLVSLPNLKLLNVSYNWLSGEIPNTGSFTKMPASCFVGNLHLCGVQIPCD